MSFEEINYWYDEAVNLFKLMNPQPEKKINSLIPSPLRQTMQQAAPAAAGRGLG